MKTKQPSRFARHNGWLSLLCCLGVGQVVKIGPLFAAEPEAPTDADAKEAKAAEPAAGKAEPTTLTEWLGGNTEYTGWADFAGGGVFVDGNKSAFQRRYGIKADGFGGASSLHWEKYLTKEGLLTIDGQAMVGNEDYAARIGYLDETKGFLRAGFNKSRTWYDGTGGFYPLGEVWYPLDDPDLHIDRERIWAEAGLTLPNWPVIGVKYSHETRQGMKNSTIWGTTQVSPGLSGVRGIAASFRDVDETRDIIEASVKHTFGKTDAEVGMRLEKTELNNSLNFRTDAGQPAELFGTQREGSDSDLFNMHAATQTRLSEKLMFTASYGYTSLDTAFEGSRIYGLDYDPVYDPALARYPGFLDLNGGSQLGQHVAGVNVAYRPVPTLSIIPSVRFESTGLESDSSYQETPSASALRNADSNKDFLNLAQRLEARYTGIKHWVLYARGDLAQGNGDLEERITTLSTGSVDLDRNTDLAELRQKYSAGANWYPLRRVNLATQYYYKENNYDYDHTVDSTPNNGANRYPAYLSNQNFNTHDVNLRVTVIPVGSLVSVSRYDFQTSQIDTTGATGPSLQSADIQTQIFSQSLSWNPLSRLYLNGTFSYVTDITETPANESTLVLGLAPVANNDFWQASFGAGYLIDDKTDIDAEYTYSEADNYEGVNTASIPYGASYQEHRVIVTLTRRISENLRVLARYGYFTNDDQTYGGYDDYTAQLVWGSVQYRF